MKIPAEKLAAIEKHFHELLLDIASGLESNMYPVLPKLTGDESKGTTPVPFVAISGMFGGCVYRFIENDGSRYLRVAASSRMDHNFERVWHVDENGYTQIDN